MTRASWGTSTSTTRSRRPVTSNQPSGGAARRQGDAGLGRVDQERQGFLEVQLHGVGVVSEVADRQVLAEPSSKSPPRAESRNAPSMAGAQIISPSMTRA